MKNYLYHFEFFSGEYSSYFYKQLMAKDERKALIEIISSFTNKEEEKVLQSIIDELGENWSIDEFWEKMDTRFHPDDYHVAYTLLNLTEIDFDLDRI